MRKITMNEQTEKGVADGVVFLSRVFESTGAM